MSNWFSGIFLGEFVLSEQLSNAATTVDKLVEYSVDNGLPNVVRWQIGSVAESEIDIYRKSNLRDLPCNSLPLKIKF